MSRPWSSPWRPAATPCTAVREHELVVGSRGELFKCWYDVGNPGESIGTIHDLDARNSRLAKWLLYDPFSDPDCTTCIALPGCMGGCAAHALVGDRDSRCGTFRHSYREQVARYVEGAARAAVPASFDPPSELPQAAVASSTTVIGTAATWSIHPRRGASGRRVTT